MKYIITETQYNFIKRRYRFIKELLDMELEGQSPCYFKYYSVTGFNGYKREVLEGVTESVIQDSSNFYDMDEEYDEKWDMIYDSLEELLSEEIEDYYDNYDCSEWKKNQDNNH